MLIIVLLYKKGKENTIQFIGGIFFDFPKFNVYTFKFFNHIDISIGFIDVYIYGEILCILC